MRNITASLRHHFERNRMVRLAVALSGLLAIGGCVDDAAVEQPDPSPLLYEIANPNGEIEGWMLGTIHTLPDGIQWRTAAIDRTVEQADILVVEVADLEDREHIAELFVELATTERMPPLTARIAPSKREELSDLIDRSPFSPGQFRSTETWAAALMLSQFDTEGDPANGVDRYVIGEFADRTVLEFEGVVDQLTIFDRLAEEDQRLMLSTVVEEASDSAAQRTILRNAWLTGDVEELERATATGMMADPEIHTAILVDRNNRWMRQLGPMLRNDKRPLVAVGAAHLVGEHGLPAQLEQLGYTVRSLH